VVKRRSDTGDSQKANVSQAFEQRLGALRASPDCAISGGLKGIEKESLRVGANGYLSQKPHPAGLGSALCNRFVTTDFSEALLEFVTPAFSSTWEALRFLCDIHQFTYERLEDEMLWVASMPCRIAGSDEIPLAQYGSSNVAQMKTAYRHGLGLRYGRDMQTIAGVHFNYSLPESFWPGYMDLLGDGGTEVAFRSAKYLGLVRNFRRFGWLVLYLFGASPAMCKSFAKDRGVDMPSLNKDTWYQPYGTSLRMSDLGYSNQNQSRIDISLNDLDAYIRDLVKAIRTPEPDYERFGVKVDGVYRQLSANQLQIENEFYSPIRPKRVARSGERPTAALRRGGVQYVEVRSLDLNISDPSGINQNTMRFMEAFLVYCLLEPSPPLDDAAMEEIRHNQTGTAREGRDAAFRLLRGGKPVTLADWAGEILDKVAAVAELIDAAEDGDSYQQAVGLMRELVAVPDATPSARLLAELQASGSSFFEYALSLAFRDRDYFAETEPLSELRHEEFDDEVRTSIQRQREIEASDVISFDEYLANYFRFD
jgi:glutamate--cysteine ligase